LTDDVGPILKERTVVFIRANICFQHIKGSPVWVWVAYCVEGIGGGFGFGKYQQEARGPWCSAAPQARGLMVWSYVLS